MEGAGRDANPLSGYRIGKTLGIGSFGKVKIAEHILTGHKVAIKILNRRKIRSMEMEEKVKREIKILRLFMHPHIIRLYEVIDTPADIYVVMEYVKSGELFDYIVEKGRLHEEEARRFFQQIISGVEYCHRNMVVHRDLKPENLLLDSKCNVKIADFGLSNVMRDGHFLKTSCGSPNYAAPEVISGKLYAGPEVDVWSCGVILYALLCGTLPFDDENIPNLFKKIKGGIYTLPSHLSPSARDLIPRMLVVDPMKRITIREIREHVWFKIRLPRYLAVPPPDTAQQVKKLDEETLNDVIKMGFDKNQLIESVQNRLQNEATVAYYLLLDNRLRTTSGYLGSEFQESMDSSFSQVIAETPTSAAELRQHGFTESPGSGLRQHFAAERKWALGLQKSLGANSTARRRPLRLSVLSGNKARPALESLVGRPPPSAAPDTPAARTTASEVDAALNRLFLARSDLAGIVSQIDELISDALKCHTVSKRATEEIESFNGFLSDTKASFKQWSSRLKQALETGPVKTEAVSENTPGTCLNTAAKGNGKLINSSSSKLPDTDPVASPCSNIAEADMIVSPSPLVSWHTGSCMVESGKQLFLLTPLPKTKPCSSRCTTSKTRMKTASSIDQSSNILRPVSKLSISDDSHPDLEQSVKVKESWTGTMTPHVAPANKVSLEDKICSPCTSSIQKSRALPRSCLKTALCSKQQLFSPIPEDLRKEDIDSNGPTEDGTRSRSSDEILKDLASRYDVYGLNQYTRQAEDPPAGDDKCSGSSDEISKDLASRYDIYGLKRYNRQAKDDLQWFLSPLKTMVLTDPSDDNPLPSPAWSNMEEKMNVPDDNPIQTPAVHSKALLGTRWKSMESTNLKGRLAGETTLKKELWIRFEAASANEVHFDKVRLQKSDAKCFLDMLEEEAS